MLTRCYILGISIVAYALLIGHSNGAGDVATGCLMDINVTGQRKKNTLALEDEIVFLPRPASLPCSILVLLVPSRPYSLGRVEPLNLCGNFRLEIWTKARSCPAPEPDAVKTFCLCLRKNPL